jgi:hypothetical protein
MTHKKENSYMTRCLIENADVSTPPESSSLVFNLPSASFGGSRSARKRGIVLQDLALEGRQRC